jgi:prevent-host-death family protein
MSEQVAVGISEAHDRLSELVAKAEAGADVTISRHGRPVLKLAPVGPAGALARGDGAAVAEDMRRRLERRTHRRTSDQIAASIREEREAWRE